MKKLLAIAALLLASTAAQAQYTFDYGGRTIRIDPDRGTVSDSRRLRQHQEERQALARRPGQRPAAQQAPQQAKGDPQAPAAEPTPAQPAPGARTAAAEALARHGECRAGGHPGLATAFRQPHRRRKPSRTRPGPRREARPGARPRRGDGSGSTGADRRHQAGSGQFADRRVADRREVKARSGSSNAAPTSAAIRWMRDRTRTASRS